MNARRKAVLCSLALSAAITASAAAQQPAQESKCEINLSNPSSVKNAFSAITIASMGKNPEDTKKRLRSAVEDLTEDSDDTENPLGHHYALGQALVSWSLQPGVSPVMSRGELGFKSNPQGTVNVLAAADSALTAVETAQPDCSSETDRVRQQAWAPLINQVGGLINDGQVDSAKALLERANTIYRGSPFNYYFVGNLAQRDSNYAAAADAYRKVVTLATPEAVAKDSNVAAIREYAAFSVAYTTLTHAEELPKDQQAAEMTKAAEAYRAYLKEYPNGEDVKAARAGLTVALQRSGNADALKGVWTEMLANPSNYSAGQLYDAGADAFRTDDLETAAKLMQAGYQMNPYLIGGLFNMANVYWKMNAFDKMADISQQLVSLHPNDPDNWQLLAIAEQGLAKATTNAKLKKARNDSVVTVLTKGNKLPVSLSFTQTGGADSSYTVAGTAENLLDKAGTYTIKFQFLDKSGNVVTTKDATVSLQPKATQDFSVQVTQPGIVAFRYAPIS
jgi:hypothetical protein